MATELLKHYGHEVYAFGKQVGSIGETSVNTVFPLDEKFDTITLYLNPGHQEAFYEQIVALKPKRVIFNPGTENPAFENTLKQQGIEPVEACTLVMLRTGQY